MAEEIIHSHQIFSLSHIVSKHHLHTDITQAGNDGVFLFLIINTYKYSMYCKLILFSRNRRSIVYSNPTGKCYSGMKLLTVMKSLLATI